MTEEKAMRISKEASETIKYLRDYFVSKMDDVNTINEKHMAFSIAVEAVRQVLVLQYDQEWRDIIFQAAEKFVPSTEENKRSWLKA